MFSGNKRMLCVLSFSVCFFFLSCFLSLITEEPWFFFVGGYWATIIWIVHKYKLRQGKNIVAAVGLSFLRRDLEKICPFRFMSPHWFFFSNILCCCIYFPFILMFHQLQILSTSLLSCLVNKISKQDNLEWVEFKKSWFRSVKNGPF